MINNSKVLNKEASVLVMEEPDSETWTSWFLDAIRKIRSQKQRPSVERICHAIRLQHDFHEEVISENLQAAVKRGDILKIFNKGQSSYKDPGGLQARPLKVNRTTDICKVIVKAVRELGERDGSTLKNIEKYLRQSHTVEEENDGDLRHALKVSSKRAVERNSIVQDNKLFRLPDKSVGVKKLNQSNDKDSQDSTPKLPAPLPICKECLGTTPAGNNNNATTRNNINNQQQQEKLIRCSECGAALHNICAPAELALLVDRGSTWSCGDCSPTCSGCQLERESQSYLIKCHNCTNCYHPDCLQPNLDKRSKAPWRCKHCLSNSQPQQQQQQEKQDKQEKQHTNNETNHHTPSKKHPNTPTSVKKKPSNVTDSNKKSVVSRKSTAGTGSGKKTNQAVAQVDNSLDGNAGVVSPRQLNRVSSPSPQSPSHPSSDGQGRLFEEKNDIRISKEKQKFFRLSAFNSKHNKLKNKIKSKAAIDPDKNEALKRSITRLSKINKKIRKRPSLTTSTVVQNRRVQPSSVLSSNESDDEEKNKKSISVRKKPQKSKIVHPRGRHKKKEIIEDEDEGSSDSSDSSNSSGKSSETLEPEKEKRNPKSKSIYNNINNSNNCINKSSNTKKEPFACEVIENKPWGFAAAAAKLSVDSSPFFSNITNTFGAKLPKLDIDPDKPTFGLKFQSSSSSSLLTAPKNSTNEKKIIIIKIMISLVRIIVQNQEAAN